MQPQGAPTVKHHYMRVLLPRRTVSDPWVVASHPTTSITVATTTGRPLPRRLANARSALPAGHLPRRKAVDRIQSDAVRSGDLVRQ